MEEGFQINTELLRYILVIVTAPVWLPFARAMWRDLNDAMRPEGGLFGEKPSKRKREEIQRQIDTEEDPQVHEPIAHRAGSPAPRSATRGPSASARPRRGPSPGGPVRRVSAPRSGPGAPRRGFR